MAGFLDGIINAIGGGSNPGFNTGAGPTAQNFQEGSLAGLPTSQLGTGVMNPNSVAGGATPDFTNGSTPASGQGNIMGMTPDQFSAMFGGMGAAISKKGSWQEGLGKFAKGLGTAQMASLAGDVKAKADKETLLQMLKVRPDLRDSLLKEAGQGLALNPNNPQAPTQ